jgi:spermidine/putrescine transport system permease protein
MVAISQRTNEDHQRAANVRSAWLLSSPALIVLLIGALGPLLIMLVYSFLTPGTHGGIEWKFSIDAWLNVLFTRDIFDETLKFADAHLSIFWRSIKLSLLTTVLTFLIGFPTAWFIATRTPKARTFWLFLITIPFWTNLLIRTFAVSEIIRKEGLLNTTLLKLGVIDQPFSIIFTDLAVFIGLAYVYLPLMVLPLYAAIDRFDMRLLEASYDLYANRWQVLRRIIMPIVKPGIIAGSILVFIPCLGAYVTPQVLGGGKNLMIGTLIELQFGQGRNVPLGAALSMVLLILVTAALLVYVRVSSKERSNG